MSTTCIPYRETGYFSDLICDYVEEKHELKPFYNQFPVPEHFKKQIEEKKACFPKENRIRLSKIIQTQYQHLRISTITLQHIAKLKEEATFTVTTGHQLNIFTGPLYFLYKIISTINLAKRLKEEYPHYYFVPVYWMATEDHDIDEINHFKYKDKRLQWNKNAAGAVGEMTTDGLDQVFYAFEEELGPGEHANYLRELFKEAYLNHHNLADATRYLVNELFGKYGLVIIDANEKELKRLFIPYIKDELLNETAYKTISATAIRLRTLATDYKIQVNPRACNLFYLKETFRLRIVKEKDAYYVNDTDIRFTEKEMLEEVENYPERFSPNVMMRPLYQEVILPNLCYIGGGGELAYWLELKAYFETFRIPFPILMLRNSALIITEKEAEKLKKLTVSDQELFLSYDDLINRKIKEISAIAIDFTPQQQQLQQQFRALYKLAAITDKSFMGAVKAQETKQLKGLERLEQRLLKAQKRKEADYVNRITALYHTFFPNKNLQERAVNFSAFYETFGDRYITTLIKELNPFKNCFLIITL